VGFSARSAGADGANATEGGGEGGAEAGCVCGTVVSGWGAAGRVETRGGGEVLADRAGAAAGAVLRVSPVSYTHLDVYKRQPSRCAIVRPWT